MEKNVLVMIPGPTPVVKSIPIEKGLGNITVDGTSVSNIKEQGNGNNSIEVSGGIGAINLKFQDTKAE